MQSKLQVLRQTRFGERIAEEELNQLERYFVATDQWNRVYSGEVDIIYGSKGAGKSAIYALIDKRQNELFNRGILIKSAENIRGNTAFSDIIADPPPTERTFVDLWKLYFLIIATSLLRDYGIGSGSDKSKALISALEEADLLPKEASLSQLFKRAKRHIWSYVFPDKEVLSGPSRSMRPLASRLLQEKLTFRPVIQSPARFLFRLTTYLIQRMLY